MALKKIKAAGSSAGGLTLADIRESLGDELMERFTEAFGGLEIAVPKGPLNERHRLVKAFGFEDAGVIQREFSGLNLYVPKKKGAESQYRYPQILQLYQSGVSPNEIAKQLGMTARAVRMGLQRLRERGHRLPYYTPKRTMPLLPAPDPEQRSCLSGTMPSALSRNAPASA